MATLKYIPISADLKDRFVIAIKQRKGVYGGAIIESTAEAIELWISRPELMEDRK
jgi:hypothetical protein